MRAIETITGPVAVLDRHDVDTDQIIPKQFLKRIERTGYGPFAFFDWRYEEDGAERPEFELNRPQFSGASVLLAGRNFGCGSSREHAAWALSDYGLGAMTTRKPYWCSAQAACSRDEPQAKFLRASRIDAPASRGSCSTKSRLIGRCVVSFSASP